MECFRWPENKYVFNRSAEKANLYQNNEIPLCSNKECLINKKKITHNEFILLLDVMILFLGITLFVTILLFYINRFK
jgi:heme/copper-type cytochrome/quinol oxidase subunit 2